MDFKQIAPFWITNGLDIRMVELANGKVVVSSREVAEKFEKRHGNVLRDIDDLIEQIQNSNALSEQLKIESLYRNKYNDMSIREYPRIENYFIKSTYVDENKIEQREYYLTRDGFSLLVMGFTGEKALKWKLNYIQAFNCMEQVIKNSLEQEYQQKITEYNERINFLLDKLRLDKVNDTNIDLSVISFLKNCCMIPPKRHNALTSYVYSEYVSYCVDNGFNSLVKKNFNKALCNFFEVNTTKDLTMQIDGNSIYVLFDIKTMWDYLHPED